MSAILRLPKELTYEQRMEKVEAVISQLNLKKCADTIVGDTMIKGISGGERKRTAIAMVSNIKNLTEVKYFAGIDYKPECPFFRRAHKRKLNSFYLSLDA
jgi:ABC-type lipopolysaccharide export system ATPase subunit